MSILITEDFNDPTTFASSWTAVGGTNLPNLSNGGCAQPGGMLACEGAAFTTTAFQTFTSTAAISVRLRMMVLITPTSPLGYSNPDPIYVYMPGPGCAGLLMALAFGNDGSLQIRTNNAGTEVQSSAGVCPVDGTPFAIQWRMTITGAFTLTYAVDIDNSTVFSGSFDWSAHPGACVSGTSGFFTRIQLNPSWTSGGTTAKWAYDTLEVDNTATKITWSTCGDMTAVGTAAPVPVITGLDITCGSERVTITGTGSTWRTFEGTIPSAISANPRPYIIGPTGTIYAIENFKLSVVSYTAGEYVVDLIDPITTGEWCALIGNGVFCTESYDNTGRPSGFDSNTGGVQYSEAFCLTADCTSAIIINCVDSTLTITGTGLDLKTVTDVTGPDGLSVAYSVTTHTDTTIVVTVTDPMTAGQYCVVLDMDPPLCASASCGGETNPMRRYRRFALPFDRDLLVFIARFEILIQSGMSPNTPWYVHFSRDGGQTFGDFIAMSAGSLGDYTKRLYLNRIGLGRNWVAGVMYQAAYPAFLIDCFVDVEISTR